MKLGDTLSKSFKEYKKNFRLYFKIILLFIFIPSIILLITGLVFPSGDVENINLTNLSINFSLSFLFLFLYVFAMVLIISSSLYEKKEYKESLKLGKKYYWKYIIFSIVFFIFILGLFLLLVIPGIIFAVYWSLASLILIAENKGIIDSLKQSKKLIKNNWWRVVGYGAVFMLIITGINMVFSIPSWPTGIMLFIDALKNPNIYLEGMPKTSLVMVHQIISQLTSYLAQFVLIPLGILFSKNIYLGLKAEKKK